MAAYMEEVRLWLGRTADKAPEGFREIGNTLFYSDNMPAVQDGQVAVHISTAISGILFRLTIFHFLTRSS
jgi:K(+)-stimulated pyrophosphate-energized sodium pump